MRSALLIVIICVLALSSFAPSVHAATPMDVLAQLLGNEFTDHTTVNKWFQAFLLRLEKFSNGYQPSSQPPKVRLEDPYPDSFFKWVPLYEASLLVRDYNQTGIPATFTGPCFGNYSATATLLEEGIHIDVEVGQQSTAGCSDYFLFATVEGMHFKTFTSTGVDVLEWKWEFGKIHPLELDWVQRNGVRVFRFFTDEAGVIAALADTVALFVPALTGPPTIDMESQKLNVKFLADHTNNFMAERPLNEIDLNKTDIHSGDFLAIIRLDGLDPMIAWGEGAHTGHTATTLWINEELYVVESTSQTNYWPKNNIQRTPWDEWIKLAKNASFNVVHLPLSKESQARFNETAAVEWFVNEAEGLPYGFQTFLVGWQDTPNENNPYPVTWQLLEIGMALVSRIDPQIAQLFVEETFNMRLGTKNLTVLEIYQYIAQHNMTFPELVIIPEQDSWIYSTGPSMVCDVLVCRVYKAAGLFGDIADQINCGEATNKDIYRLHFFDQTYVRPEVCVYTDTDTGVCQILGDFRMSLPDFNTLDPYPHMSERCPGNAPVYYRPPGC